MIKKFEFITTEREDLVDIAKIFAQAVDPALLTDKCTPVTVSLCGSFNAGKSIFIDILRNEIFDTNEQPHFSGRKNYDEYWQGKVNNNLFDLHYIDFAYPGGYHHPILSQRQDKSKLDVFMSQRLHGGVTVIQNHSRPVSCDFNIWIESPRNYADTRITTEPITGNRHVPAKLKNIFQAAHDMTLDKKTYNSWTRYVEIIIANNNLATPSLLQAYGDLRDKLNATATELFVENNARQKHLNKATQDFIANGNVTDALPRKVSGPQK